MKYLLDTNICIYIINKHPAKIQKKFNRLKIGDVGISSITFGELQYGVSNSSNPVQNQRALDGFLAPLEIFDFPADACPLYGDIRAKLKATGKTIGPLDLLIGVHAVFLETILVTNNTKKFSNIPGLKIENWI